MRTRDLARPAGALLESLEVRRMLSAGDLDPTFSGDGKQIIDIAGSGNETANAVQVDGSGRVVMAGRMLVGSETDFAVVRLSPDGTPDAAFGGGDGVVSIDFAINDEATDLAIDSSGRIVVVGTSSAGAGSNARDFAVARLLANGTPDTTFSGDGKLQIDFGSNDDAQAVALDGELIYVGGYKDFGSTGQFALARLTNSGALDASYSGDGRVFFAYGSNNDSRCFDITIDDAGRVVMAGYDNNLSAAGHTRNLAVARLGTNAVLDPSFNGDGLFAADVLGDDEGRAVAVDFKGRVVAGGFTEGSVGGDDFAAIRLTDGGALDTSFNTDGKFTLDLGNVDHCEDLVLQPDGTITLAGNTLGSGFQAAVVQLSPFTGLPSTSFGDGGDGVQLVDFGAIDQGFAIALAPDFRTVVAGTDGSGKIAVGRLQDLIDTNFKSTTGGTARDLIPLPDGKMLELSLTSIKRLLPDGAADPTFTTINAGDMLFQDMAVDGLGRIVAGGQKDDGSGHLAAAVRRYLAGGAPDTSFSGDGETLFHYNGTDLSTIAKVAIDATNRVVVGGSRFAGGDRDPAVARLLPSGALDPTFDGDGINILVLNNLTLEDDVKDVAIQANGRIVLVGLTAGTTISTNAYVARLDTDGSRDGTFAGNGVRTFDLGFNSNAQANAVAIDAGGRIVVVGEGNLGPSDQGFVARFTSSGAFDDTFAGDGFLTLQFSPLGETINGVAIDGSGDIYTTGSIPVDADGSRVLVRKLTPNGASGVFGFSGDGAWALPGTVGAVGDFPILVDGAIYVAAPGASVRRLNVDPAVVDFQFLFETAPQRLRVQFNDDVEATLADADLQIRNATTNLTLANSAYDLVSYDEATNTAIVQFNSILADGDYRATFSSTGIVNAQGMSLGGNRVREFFFLQGDANHDRRVNLADFNVLAANFGRAPRTFSQGDFSYDGQVNLNDFNILASRFGSALAPAATAPSSPRGGDALDDLLD